MLRCASLLITLSLNIKLFCNDKRITVWSSIPESRAILSNERQKRVGHIVPFMESRSPKFPLFISSVFFMTVDNVVIIS